MGDQQINPLKHEGPELCLIAPFCVRGRLNDHTREKPTEGSEGRRWAINPCHLPPGCGAGRDGPSPQPPGPRHRGHQLSQCPLAPRCSMSPVRGGIVAHGALQPPSMAGAAPSHGQDELCEVSAWLPADKLLSRQLPPDTPFGSYFGRGVSGADSGRILPLPPGRRSRAGGG